MQREFTADNVCELSEEDHEFILTQQAEMFRHIQGQAQKFFRTLIAAFAIIIGLTWTDFYNVIVGVEGVQQLLSSNTVFKNGAAATAPGIVEDSLFVGVILFVISAGLLLDAGITAIRVMKIDGPLPTARRKNTELDVDRELADLTLKEQWILANDERITEALLDLNRCYTLIWAAFGFGSLGAMLIAVTAIGFLSMMGVLHVIALLAVPASILYYVKDPLIVLIRDQTTDDLRDRLSRAGERYVDSYEYVGPSAGMKMGVLFIYSNIWDYSPEIIHYWMSFP